MTSEDDDDDDDDVGLEEELLHQDTDSDAAQSSDSDGLLSVLLTDCNFYPSVATIRFL